MGEKLCTISKEVDEIRVYVLWRICFLSSNTSKMLVELSSKILLIFWEVGLLQEPAK